MTALSWLNLVLAAAGAVLAIVLLVVYWKNHRQIRSAFTLGLLLFSLFVLLHNSMAVDHSLAMMTSASTSDQSLLLAENLLEMGGLVALVVATLR
ncbi:MAG: hypothetical protein ACYDCK_08480 [Thermoplasmatota archaeon]